MNKLRKLLIYENLNIQIMYIIGLIGNNRYICKELNYSIEYYTNYVLSIYCQSLNTFTLVKELFGTNELMKFLTKKH